LGELLLFGQIPLGIAGGLLPVPYLLYPGSGTQMPLRDLSTNLKPGRGYEVA
jgi:hypothetical protein